MPESYRMPKVAIGDIVHYFRVETDKPVAGIVTSFGFRSADLSIFRHNGMFGFIDGVRHCSDPELVNPNVAGQGMWRHKEETELIEQQKKAASETKRTREVAGAKA